MKKLIVLLVGLLIASNIFGQSNQGTCSGVWANIEEKSEHIKLDDPKHSTLFEPNISKFVKNFDSGSYAMVRLTTYSFVEEGRLYMISYDTIKKYTTSDKRSFTRDLYLYCWNNGVWNKASDLIQTDYWKTEYIKENGYTAAYISAETYFPRMEGVNLEQLGKVANTFVERVGDVVKIKMTCSVIGHHNIESRLYSKMILFVSNGDGTYSVWKPSIQMK